MHAADRHSVLRHALYAHAHGSAGNAEHKRVLGQATGRASNAAASSVDRALSARRCQRRTHPVSCICDGVPVTACMERVTVRPCRHESVRKHTNATSQALAIAREQRPAEQHASATHASGSAWATAHPSAPRATQRCRCTNHAGAAVRAVFAGLRRWRRGRRPPPRPPRHPHPHSASIHDPHSQAARCPLPSPARPQAPSR